MVFTYQEGIKASLGVNKNKKSLQVIKEEKEIVHTAFVINRKRCCVNAAAAEDMKSPLEVLEDAQKNIRSTQNQIQLS